jgi:hypothetical protein
LWMWTGTNWQIIIFRNLIPRSTECVCRCSDSAWLCLLDNINNYPFLLDVYRESPPETETVSGMVVILMPTLSIIMGSKWFLFVAVRESRLNIMCVKRMFFIGLCASFSASQAERIEQLLSDGSFLSRFLICPSCVCVHACIQRG